MGERLGNGRSTSFFQALAGAAHAQRTIDFLQQRRGSTLPPADAHQFQAAVLLGQGRDVALAETTGLSPELLPELLAAGVPRLLWP